MVRMLPRCTTHTTIASDHLHKYAAARNTRIDLKEKAGQLNSDYGAGAEHERVSS